MRRRFLVALILASVILSAAYGVYEFQLKPSLKSSSEVGWKGTVDLLVSSADRVEIANYGTGMSIDRTDPLFERILGHLKSSTLMKATDKTVVQGTTTVSVTIPLPHYSLTFELNNGSRLKLDLVTENGVGVIWFESESAIYQVQVSSDLVKLCEEVNPTPTPIVSPYLAEFRSHPENFMSYTKILYVLVNDKSGRTVANLTYALQFARINYTVRATLNCSLKAAPEVANVSFGVASCWLITEGTTPVPMPYPVAFAPTHTLRDGESVTIKPEAVGNGFDEDWEWVQFSCIATLNKITVTFNDGHLFTYDEVIETVNTGGDLFEFLHNNPVGTEERVFVSE